MSEPLPSSTPSTPPAPAPRQRPVRWLLRFLCKALIGLVLIGMAGWMFLAVRIADRHGTPPRTVVAAIVALIPLVLVVILRRRRVGLIIFLLAFAAVLGWYFSLKPSHDRDWQRDVALLPYATIE